MDHPERNAQFEHLNAQAEAFQAQESGDLIDAKKNELVEDFKNPGQNGIPMVNRSRYGCILSSRWAWGKHLRMASMSEESNAGWVNVLGSNHRYR